MLGIAAITANNGWAMAFTGACIVMVGLAVLAFVISQLHKIIGLVEKGKSKVPVSESTVKQPTPDLSAADIDILRSASGHDDAAIH